jgi:hypothetical protein
MRCSIARIATTCLIVGGLSLPVHGIEETTYGGKTYGLVAGGGWWYGAEQQAQLYGGHLVTIDDPGMNAWLTETFSGAGTAWIGLNYTPSSGPKGNIFNWKWAGTDSNSPLYRNFAVGYPNTSVYGDDYAAMRMSDGKWLDADSPGVWPDLGIYEVGHTSVVPITMDLSLCATAELYYGWGDTRFGGTPYGTKSANAYVEGEVPDPMNPEGPGFFSQASANIAFSDGSWGTRIETNLHGGMGMGSASAGLNDPGAMTIGTTIGAPIGTLLQLEVDANMIEGEYGAWSLVLKRGGDTLLSLDDEGEHTLSVYAGETLTVEFSNSVVWYSANLAVNMWVVPEPAAFSLLMIAGLCGIGYAWRRRSNRQQHR